MYPLSRFTNVLAGLFFSASALFAAPAPSTLPATIVYNPPVKIVQGNQPLVQSYNLSITGPGTLPPNTSVDAVLEFTVLSAPLGQSGAALGFVSANPPILTFTSANQILTTVITVNVPVGSFAGDYSWKIRPTGWPTSLNVQTDPGATINATVAPVVINSSIKPTIALGTPLNGTTFTYQPTAVPPVPVSFPIQFTADVATGGGFITTVGASVAGAPVTVSATPAGLGTLQVSGTATSPNITSAGIYTVQVFAQNMAGTSYATADINVVVSAPPPTITILNPTSTSYQLFGAFTSVPVSISSTSAYGNITSLTASVGGAPVTLSKTGEGAALTATGTGSITLTAAGSYTMTVTAKNDYGTTTSDVRFNVASVNATPTVSILTPANGAVFQRFVGDPATPVAYTFQGSTVAGTTIKSLNLTLTSNAVSTPVTPATLNGLNTTSVSGGGTLLISTPGTYTLSATEANAYAIATTATTFTVGESIRTFCADLTWLPPISLNKTIDGGSTMPIKFTLTCNEGGLHFVRDTSVTIAIYDASNPASVPTIYPYSSGSPNPPTYAIDGNHYQLNFRTAPGAHVYRIEVYGGTQQLGTKELHTVAKGKSGDDDHDDRDDDDDDNDDDHHHGDAGAGRGK